MCKHMKKTKFNVAKHFNKLAALVGIMAGLLAVVVLNDATALVVALFIAVPLIFSRKNVYYH